MKQIYREIIAMIGTVIIWELFSLGTNAELIIVVFLGLIYMKLNNSPKTSRENENE